MIEIDVSHPIYQQIMDGITRRLVRGDLTVGDQIPSQREMAVILRVSPNTVQRAYRDLEALGVVETQRGQGTFVAAPPELVDSLRQEMLRKALARFVQEMLGLGVGRSEIPKVVQDALSPAAPNANMQKPEVT
ncbi:MAG: GntR family transcriptional regulator [Bacillota bacterium]|nr:GntR family transcriptional regulator [Bacillota bacterium]